MPNYICTTCGVQYAESALPPTRCLICEDERQYVPARGQHWTTLEALRGGHSNTWRALVEPALLAIRTVPAFGIDQRALLVRTPHGNLLWDCIALLDDATMAIIRALGGLTGIALSHPHYYSTMAEWGRAFDVPVWVHTADREHVTRPDPCLRFWEGETQAVLPDITLHRLGGHYAALWRRQSGGFIDAAPDPASADAAE